MGLIVANAGGRLLGIMGIADCLLGKNKSLARLSCSVLCAVELFYFECRTVIKHLLKKYARFVARLLK